MAAHDQVSDLFAKDFTVSGFQQGDLEKSASPPKTANATACQDASGGSKWLGAMNALFVRYGLETRGIQRVEPDERHDLKTLGHSQIAIIWLSINLAGNNIILGMLGPIVFQLNFLDSCLSAVFGMLVGSLAVGYMATFGPYAGNRSMIVARYSMGWWPSKLVVVLNIIVLLGYALIDATIAGQILSAVSNGNITVVVGILLTSLVTFVVSSFGYRVFHHYERYAYLPQLVVFCILAGVAGPSFNLSGTSQGDMATVAGNRLSFFSLCLAAAITYSGGAADYFSYYPEDTSRWKVFSLTIIGLSVSFTFAFILGIGLASGTANVQVWSDAYDKSQGALIVEGFMPLGKGFGGFCSVVVALGLVANMIPPTYSSGIDFQILGRPALEIPRVMWNFLGVVVYTVCAAAGRAYLAEIFTNFLALMGYWVVIWMAIMLEEHFIFRRKTGFDWAAWNRRSELPLGFAAMLSFLIGWTGAILGMAQVWYVGPIARLVGEHGTDLGNYLGFVLAAITFPLLRYVELKVCVR